MLADLDCRKSYSLERQLRVLAVQKRRDRDVLIGGASGRGSELGFCRFWGLGLALWSPDTNGH